MLLYLKKSKCACRINPIDETWFSMNESTVTHLPASLSAVTRLLLASGGSMTQMLEVLTGSTVTMMIKRQEILTDEGCLPQLTCFRDSKIVLAREAWLASGGKPLIYAHSLLRADDEGPYSLESIRGTEKPLGRMLIDDGVKTFRGDLAIGMARSEDIADYLDVPSDTNFWGRYYSLSTNAGLSGIIFELFSPRLLRI